MCMDQSLKFQKLKSATKIAYSIHVGLSYQPAGSTHTHTYINVIYIYLFNIYIYIHTYFFKNIEPLPRPDLPPKLGPWPRDTHGPSPAPTTIPETTSTIPWLSHSAAAAIRWTLWCHESGSTGVEAANQTRGAQRGHCGPLENAKLRSQKSIPVWRSNPILYIYNYIIQILSPEVWNANSYPGLV